MRAHPRTFGLLSMVAVLALAVSSMSACSDDDSDTASTEATVEQTTTTTVVEEPGVVTAETTGYVFVPLPPQPIPPNYEVSWEVEVTMDDGSVRSFPTDRETLPLIAPDLGAELEEGQSIGIRMGERVEIIQIAGIRVVIEEVDGQQRITGPAE